MLEMWLSKERLLSNSTPRFLNDDEESREQPSSVRQCSRLLLVWFLGLIIKNLVVRNYSSSVFFYIDYAFHKFLNLVCFTRPWRNIELSIIPRVFDIDIWYWYFPRVTCKAWKVMALVLSLEVLHTALVIDMIPLHSLLRIDGGQISIYSEEF